jgi:hypothetical protein
MEQVAAPFIGGTLRGVYVRQRVAGAHQRVSPPSR